MGPTMPSRQARKNGLSEHSSRFNSAGFNSQLLSINKSVCMEDEGSNEATKHDTGYSRRPMKDCGLTHPCLPTKKNELTLIAITRTYYVLCPHNWCACMCEV